MAHSMIALAADGVNYLLIPLLLYFVWQLSQASGARWRNTRIAGGLDSSSGTRAPSRILDACTSILEGLIATVSMGRRAGMHSPTGTLSPILEDAPAATAAAQGRRTFVIDREFQWRYLATSLIMVLGYVLILLVVLFVGLRITRESSANPDSITVQ